MPGVLQEGAGITSRYHWLILIAILAGTLALRLPGLTWGLPPATPEVRASGLRTSYAFDEDDILTHAAAAEPQLYHWGMLHFQLLRGWMAGAEALGCCGTPWRDAFHNLTVGAFERVYAAGRMLSVVEGLLLIVLVFLAGREWIGPGGGLWAAAITGASPVHLLASTQIRVDLTMTCMLVLALWLALRTLRDPRRRYYFLLGAAGALAVVAKYTAVFLVGPIAISALAARRFPRKAMLMLAGGAIAGSLLGQPYVLWRLPAMMDQVGAEWQKNRTTPPAWLLPPPLLLLKHGEMAARFAVGPGIAALAAAGIVIAARRRGWLLLAGVSGVAISFIPLLWPLLRYQVPLLPYLALCAALALAQLGPPARIAVGGAALVFPLAASLAQMSYQRTMHTGNQALAAILKAVPPGDAIARVVPEMPPLDPRTYPMGLNPDLTDLRPDPPPWILDGNLSGDVPLPHLRQLLRERYTKVDEWTLPRKFAWATLGEQDAPHDWKYTHPRLTLYRRNDSR